MGEMVLQNSLLLSSFETLFLNPFQKRNNIMKIFYPFASDYLLINLGVKKITLFLTKSDLV